MKYGRNQNAKRRAEARKPVTPRTKPARSSEEIVPLQRMVRARQSANRRMMTYITGMQAAENDARSSDARWNEKFADYWKGRRDGLREAIAMIGPNDRLQ